MDYADFFPCQWQVKHLAIPAAFDYTLRKGAIPMTFASAPTFDLNSIADKNAFQRDHNGTITGPERDPSGTETGPERDHFWLFYARTLF